MDRKPKRSPGTSRPYITPRLVRGIRALGDPKISSAALEARTTGRTKAAIVLQRGLEPGVLGDALHALEWADRYEKHREHKARERLVRELSG